MRIGTARIGAAWVSAGMLAAGVAHATPENLLANPGFEAGQGEDPDAWAIGAVPDGVTIKRDERFKHEGVASLRLSKTVRNFWPLAQVSQWFDVDAARGGLEVGAVVRARNVQKVVIDVQFAGGGQSSHKWAVYVGAENEGDPAADHGWEGLSGAVAIPEWTERAAVALQIYGPGVCWVDDAFARYGGEPAAKPGPHEVTTEERTAGDERMRYFLNTPVEGGAPEGGHRLLLVLPGGDGSAEFQGFVTNIASRATSEQYLVAQLVAPEASDPDRLVWPIEKNPDPNIPFSTEAFVDAVIEDIGSRDAINPRYVFMLGWSSGGPPSYSATLREGAAVRGALVAMSVFHPETVPDLGGARGRAFYLLHSPEDFIAMRFPADAKRRLSRAGAQVELVEYAGGHGWHGDMFGMIRDGIVWLEEHAEAPEGEGG